MLDGMGSAYSDMEEAAQHGGQDPGAYYEDEGMDFQGSFIDGVDKAWRPHIDEVIEEDEACKYK